MNRAFGLLPCLLIACSARIASAELFHFDALPHAILPSFESTAGNVTLTVTSTVNGGFVFSVPPASSVASVLGLRHLVGLQTVDVKSDNCAPLKMSFSKPVISLSLDAWDGGGDDDGLVRIRAFDSTGIEIANDAKLHPAGDASIISLSVAAPGISYIIADSIGGPSNFNSMGWDNVLINVPEPAGVAIVACGAFFLAGARRRAGCRAGA